MLTVMQPRHVLCYLEGRVRLHRAELSLFPCLSQEIIDDELIDQLAKDRCRWLIDYMSYRDQQIVYEMWLDHLNHGTDGAASLLVEELHALSRYRALRSALVSLRRYYRDNKLPPKVLVIGSTAGGELEAIRSADYEVCWLQGPHEGNELSEARLLSDFVPYEKISLTDLMSRGCDCNHVVITGHPPADLSVWNLFGSEISLKQVGRITGLVFCLEDDTMTRLGCESVGMKLVRIQDGLACYQRAGGSTCS